MREAPGDKRNDDPDPFLKDRRVLRIAPIQKLRHAKCHRPAYLFHDEFDRPHGVINREEHEMEAHDGHDQTARRDQERNNKQD